MLSRGYEVVRVELLLVRRETNDALIGDSCTSKLYINVYTKNEAQNTNQWMELVPDRTLIVGTKHERTCSRQAARRKQQQPTRSTNQQEIKGIVCRIKEPLRQLQ